MMVCTVLHICVFWDMIDVEILTAFASDSVASGYGFKFYMTSKVNVAVLINWSL